jgi:GDP-D-mannose 3',5'-epimerase
MKTAIVCGAGGFIGYHLVNRLKKEGYFVWGIDRKLPEFGTSSADKFDIKDLRYAPLDFNPWIDEVYQFAAEMGGASYIFTGENDAEIMRNSTLINLNVLEACRRAKVGKVFFSSSACIYPDFVQSRPDSASLKEVQAYPARPDSNYGWEKLYAERLYDAYRSNYGLCVRVGRLHNVFGPLCTWQHGREKAPAAICRKVAQAVDGGTIDIFGDGKQTRSFLYIDEAIEGILRLMRSEVSVPVNIGSSEMVSINQLVHMVADIAGKRIEINHIHGPQGVRGRSSDNTFVQEKLDWSPSAPLVLGLEKLYHWIESEVMRNSTPREDKTQPLPVTGEAFGYDKTKDRYFEPNQGAD